ncbi:hypothetical protein CEXT_679721 [Caerostris extrusa]|uniref:Uncharacterized protein n=1 Tax=Caerostris extrusa TaxID=172846 RepID=A0AAV4XAA3_CAEEX|nr:hypothetical protein CEXT_679721 [Caerostris extrusa]
MLSLSWSEPALSADKGFCNKGIFEKYIFIMSKSDSDNLGDIYEDLDHLFSPDVSSKNTSSQVKSNFSTNNCTGNSDNVPYRTKSLETILPKVKKGEDFPENEFAPTEEYLKKKEIDLFIELVMIDMEKKKEKHKFTR